MSWEVIIKHKKWREKIDGEIVTKWGWQLATVDKDGDLDFQWPYPNESNRNMEGWEALHNYGGKYVCIVASAWANISFAKKKQAQLFVDEWVIPHVLAKYMSGDYEDE